MGLPLNRRDYDIFLSYAHSDRSFVEQIYQWLQQAGLEVWWDDRDMSAGALLATELQKAIERCRAVILVATDDSVARGWVQAEYNIAMDERANYKGFRVVVLRMENANVNDFLIKGMSWIDVPNNTLDADLGLAIVRALYPSENRPNPVTAHDIFISASWQSEDNESATAVCKHLSRQGFRLIGDSKDQKGFESGHRSEQIMSSCGAFVSIIPYRGEDTAVAGEKPYNYFLQEIDFAAEQSLPSLVIADPRIKRADGHDQNWLRMETDNDNVPQIIQNSLQSIWDRWRKPLKPHYIFYAMDLDSENKRLMGPVRQLIQLITSMPTIVGDEVHEGNPESTNAAVRAAVSDAFLVIADLTDDNVNACIEAGMALAVGTNVELLAAGPQRRPPFMLRERNMPTYNNEVQKIGLLHKISRHYRRRVINAEL